MNMSARTSVISHSVLHIPFIQLSSLFLFFSPFNNGLYSTKHCTVTPVGAQWYNSLGINFREQDQPHLIFCLPTETNDTGTAFQFMIKPDYVLRLSCNPQSLFPFKHEEQGSFQSNKAKSQWELFLENIKIPGITSLHHVIPRSTTAEDIKIVQPWVVIELHRCNKELFHSMDIP